MHAKVEEALFFPFWKTQVDNSVLMVLPMLVGMIGKLTNYGAQKMCLKKKVLQLLLLLMMKQTYNIVGQW